MAQQAQRQRHVSGIRRDGEREEKRKRSGGKKPKKKTGDFTSDRKKDRREQGIEESRGSHEYSVVTSSTDTSSRREASGVSRCFPEFNFVSMLDTAQQTRRMAMGCYLPRGVEVEIFETQHLELQMPSLSNVGKDRLLWSFRRFL